MLLSFGQGSLRRAVPRRPGQQHLPDGSPPRRPGQQSGAPGPDLLTRSCGVLPLPHLIIYVPILLCCNIELLLRQSKSFGPSAPIAYATSVSPPNEAVAWPGHSCWMQDEAAAWPRLPFLQITARTNPCSRHLWGTLARAVASILAHRARR